MATPAAMVRCALSKLAMTGLLDEGLRSELDVAISPRYCPSEFVVDVDPSSGLELLKTPQPPSGGEEYGSLGKAYLLGGRPLRRLHMIR